MFSKLSSNDLPIPPYAGKQALLSLKFSKRSIEELSLTTVRILSSSRTFVSGYATAAKFFLSYEHSKYKEQ